MTSPTASTRRLNITNGDSAAGTLGEAGIEGKIIPWRDVLHEGPVDASLPLEQLSRQRARFIADHDWDEFAHVSGNFAERDYAIRHLDYFDEIVLWFEDDLYDQLQLIQLLDFFGAGAARDKKLSLIVVDGYIPPLSAKQIRELDETRPRVTDQQLALAAKAWHAFGSPDPSAVVKLLDESTSALPYLARALTRELEEFPSVDNGLSRSEREALTAIVAGHNTPVQAFLEVARQQESIFLGDMVFYSYLERLSGKNNALVTWKDGTPIVAPDPRRAREFVDGAMKVTPLGREVLAGQRDWQTINTTARWLGGVEIKPGTGGWRWDREQRQLVLLPQTAPAGKRPSRKTTRPPRKTARTARKKTSTTRPRESSKPGNRRKPGKTGKGTRKR